MSDRRPLGLPVFSADASDRPAVPGPRPLPLLDRALFLPPPSDEPQSSAPARRPLADRGPLFSGGA
ncbi:hypothetical protein [Kitasatospora sp. NPDC088346]|uniref:hypothetical protein n=1 Tax=Kitasatospora sp. NPDC088346 TaxID=3364073 RepID=UPI0037FE6482